MEDGFVGFILGICVGIWLMIVVLILASPDTTQDSLCDSIQIEYQITTAYDSTSGKCYIEFEEDMMSLDSYFGQ